MQTLFRKFNKIFVFKIGNDITEITEANGKIKTLKRSTDIFCSLMTTITNEKGSNLLVMKKSKDIFGNWTTKIDSEEEGANLQLLLILLKD